MRATTDVTRGGVGGGRLRHLELLFQYRERILVAQLRADVDKDKTKGGRDGDRDQYTEQTEQRPASEQREDHHGRVELHDAADDERDHQIVLSVTKDRVHHGHGHHVPDLRQTPRRRVAERHQASDRAGGDRTHDRDHLEHAGHDREEENEWDLQNRKADEGRRGHHPDEEHLPAHVAPQQSVDLREQRDDLVPLARRQESPQPLEEPWRVAQQEERRDQEDEELEQKVAKTNDERDSPARDHMADIPDAREVDDEGVQIFQAELIRSLSERVLRVRDERRKRALQIAQLVDCQGNQDPAATDYGGDVRSARIVITKAVETLPSFTPFLEPPRRPVFLDVSRVTGGLR